MELPHHVREGVRGAERSARLSSIGRLAPGLAVAVAVAIVARLVADAAPAYLNEILVAVLLGIVFANVGRPLPASVAPGVRFAVQRVLRFGIILLGARLSLQAVVAIGAGALGLVLVSMSVAFTAAILVGRGLRLPPRLALLIGVGTAVCGNSAIVATAPVIDAEDRETSFAVATITLFGTLALFLYPFIGHALALGDTTFGVWSGVAVNDTSQVVATSGAYSLAARDVATVVKLVRNALMAPLIVGIAWWWRRSGEAAGQNVGRSVRSAVPLFVLGFLALALLRTLGIITPALAGPIDYAATTLILIALAGVGLNTRVVQLRSIGATPFFAGLATASVLAALSLSVIVGLGVAPH
ncbi:MAG: putative sulfate exporter family transporter [Chloroflexota bacterium]|nr:putative sulfate exporter family transporter [Chloroflexota bacterium]MDE3193764.1 putative sulfate exporter family transporter [Chloroflexota bacterium]